MLYKRAKLTGNFSKYRAMRNKVTSELRSAKRSYFQRLNPKKPKDFWRAMKYLNKQQSTIPTLVDEHEVEATSNIEKADMLNSFFCKCFNPSGVLGENAGYSTNPGPPGEISGDEDLYCDVDNIMWKSYFLNLMC